jgi:adenylate cyclase
MAKILVVDDEADLELLIKQKFRRQIREEVYQFVFAINGRHALETLKQHTDIDVVLTDINMPEMDGLTLLGKMHEMNLLIKSVVVSAYGDMENIRTAMNRGAFDFVTKPVNFDDLGLTIEKTIQHVNQMKQTLKAIKENDILKMYVDESVLNFMDSREYENSLTASETLEATVVFIDICGFTSISEKETPETVVGLLNSYFDLITREILAQSGFIDKFIGDCVMAVFKGEHHLDRALDACLAVRDQINSLPEAGSGHFVPKVSIGVNCGEMVSGNIGSANLRRLDYTVIGDTVNTAQRLQSAAAPGQIVINQASYEKVKQSFNCREIGMVSLKNKAGEIKIYEVVE